MLNLLRYISNILMTSSVFYLAMTSSTSATSWLMIMFILIILNQTLVSLLIIEKSKSTNLITLSLLLSSLSLLSSILGSLFFLLISPQVQLPKSSIFLILFMHTCSIHSTLSSLELLKKLSQDPLISP